MTTQNLVQGGDTGRWEQAIYPFLDHSSPAVTTVYLRQLEGDRGNTWRQVAGTIGV